jgi:hypothetical protein
MFLGAVRSHRLGFLHPGFTRHAESTDWECRKKANTPRPVSANHNKAWCRGVHRTTVPTSCISGSDLVITAMIVPNRERRPI